MPTKNVVMVAFDDLLNVVRYRDAFGPTFITPNMDRLMAQGINFENAFATTPLCKPSRAAVMTGQLAFTTGIFHNRDQDLLDGFSPAQTLPGWFANSGYFSTGMGKLLHHVADPRLPLVFDDWQATSGPDHYGGDLFGYGPARVPEEATKDALTAEWAANFIGSYTRTEPYFLSVGIEKPHLNWVLPQAYFDLYDVTDIVTPDVPDDDWASLPDFFKQFFVAGFSHNNHLNALAGGEWENLIHAYMAAVSYADAQLGRVLDALDAAGAWADTTFVLWSDHGWHLGDHDKWNKFTLWESAASVPLVIADPDFGTGGTTVVEPVSLLDVFPTIAGLTGVTPPIGLEGEDLTTLINDPTATLGRSSVITHAFGSLSVRTEDWRLNFYNSGELELFDIGADPMNFYDLSDDPAYATELASMLIELKLAASAAGITLALSDETVSGGSGNEIFSAATGAEVFGGGGDDVYYVTDGVVVTELQGGGWDAIFVASAGDYILPDEVEELVLSFGWAKGSVYSGNSGGNVLRSDRSAHEMQGQGGNDLILASDGNDTLGGGIGNDTLHGDDGDDVAVGGLGADCMTGGAGDDWLAGNNAADAIDGGAGNDSIDGGNAADTLWGGDGNDTINGGGLTDLVHGGEDDDVVFGGGNSDTLSGDGGADTLYGQSAGDDLYGGDGDDFLLGGAGNDAIQGGAGNDTILGSTGNDDLFGNAGSDIYQFAAGHGTLDRIYDFEDGIDQVAFEVSVINDIDDLALTDVFAGVDVNYGTGTIRILGVNAIDLTNADFVFL